MVTFHDIWWFLVTFDDYWWFFMIKTGDLSWLIMIHHDWSWKITIQLGEAATLACPEMRQSAPISALIILNQLGNCRSGPIFFCAFYVPESQIGLSAEIGAFCCIWGHTRHAYRLFKIAWELFDIFGQDIFLKPVRKTYGHIWPEEGHVTLTLRCRRTQGNRFAFLLMMSVSIRCTS